MVADVGATKCLFAVAEVVGRDVRLRNRRQIPTCEVPSPNALLAEALAGAAPAPTVASLAVPGPVVAGACRTTNLPWFLDANDLARRAGLDTVVLVNDLAAAGRGLPATPPDRLVVLHGEQVRADRTLALLGLGSGLGQAVVVPEGTGHRVLASEGGHADFAPQGALQRALAAELEATLGHVSVERVLSGPGLVRIYDFLVSSGMPAAPEVAAAAAHRRPELISELALARTQVTCEQALDIFVRILGAEAGNLALRALAHGGVVVMGGIAPRLLEKLADGGVVAAFLAKGRMRTLLERIPLAISTDADAPLRGAALLALEEGAFAGD